MSLRFFTDAELACPTTGQLQLAPGFGQALDELRAAFNEAMVLNSACRSLAHNQKVGGHATSFHLIGNPKYGTDTCAVDVATGSGPYRGRLVALAWARGWSIGIAATFTHLDLRSRYTALPQTTYLY